MTKENESIRYMAPTAMPDYMNDVHVEVLHALWHEGKTPGPMAEELQEMFPELSDAQCRGMVHYWMWDVNLFKGNR